MTEAEQNDLIDQDILLKKFKHGDFESAKASLLERYHIWNGLLIANDEQSVITPDDLNHFRLQASDLLEQEIKSAQESEQLKILTVLIYLLMEAQKTALPGDNPELQAQLDMLDLEHIEHYIMRRITHGADQLSYADIENFVRYENLVLSSYITSMSPEEENTNNTVQSLKSQDGVYFDLIDTPYEIQLQRLDGPGTRQVPEPVIEPGLVEEVIPIPQAEAQQKTGLEPLIMRDETAQFLVNTMQFTHLQCGPEITLGCYVGKNRERNEDGIVVNPDHNQVVVIDAMGGYGNGVTARDEFVNSAMQHPSDIEAVVKHAQNQYDEVGLDQGGVCIINTQIELVDNSYRLTLSQAGDVHAILFDDNGEIKHETVDEAIGHQVINAIIGAEATASQRKNGWENFGRLTRATLRAKPGWRMLVYSDGIANHFDAQAMTEMAVNCTAKQALAAVSKAVDEAMQVDGSYKDNVSLAIIDM